MSGRGRGLTLPAWMTKSESIGNDTPSQSATGNAVCQTQVSNLNSVGNGEVRSTPGPSMISQAAPPAPSLFIPPQPIFSTKYNSFVEKTISQPVSTTAPSSTVGSFGQLGAHMNFAPIQQLYQVPRPIALPSFVAPTVAVTANPIAPPPVVGDPNNNVQCWSEHVTEDGRRYWHNRVSLVSTYDKPFCLKSPEERSIPPCEWKEYSKDGKKYYSNGKESTYSKHFSLIAPFC